MDDVPKNNRTALLHVRVKPELREVIVREAAMLHIRPSSLIRKILAQHYERPGS